MADKSKKITHAAKEVDQIYLEARTKFIKEYENNVRDALRRLDPEVSGRTVREILKEPQTKPAKRSPSTKLAIIDLMIPERSPRLYHRLANAIGQDPREVDAQTSYEIFQNKSVANLYYFRFIRDQPKSAFRIVSGTLRIQVSNGISTFSHFIDDETGIKKFLHNGFVFIRENRITMLGWRESVFRLAIVHMPRGNWDPKTKILHGGVVSVARLHMNSYLARCIVVCEGHPYCNGITEFELKKKIANSTIEDYGFISWI